MSAAAELTMAATPQQSTAAFVEAINDADLEAAIRCFAKDACLLTPDSTAIRGREEIRQILAQLIAREAKIEVEARSILLAGEVAIGSERWVIRSAGPQGAVFAQTSSPTLVLRCLEQTWKLAIAAPWGWGGGAGGR